MKKSCKHICANCWYFNEGNCYNCDSPSDVREKNPNDVCDGGGCGAEVYGFTPKDEDNSYTITKDDESLIYDLSNSEFPLAEFWNDLQTMTYTNPRIAKKYNFNAMKRDIVKIAKTFNYYYEKSKKEQDL